MSFEESKTKIFNLLKSTMSKHADTLSIEKDCNDTYYLNTLKLAQNKKPHFFGAVQIKKNYVSYHLMPVYVSPSLLDTISDNLRKKMQGKSCFNFKAVDKQLFKELNALTQSSYAYYYEEGYV